MKIYITFGQVHCHAIGGKTFDKDCVAVIKCESHGQGREIAFDAFGDKFFTSYEESNMPKMEYFPRGFIELN